MEMARVPAAWAAGHGRGDGVIVAVLDGGFQMDHPDFDPTRWYKPYDAFRLREGPPVDDGPPPAAAHGSLVAGIIGAETNNGIGVAGIASRVQLMPVKVLRWQSGVYEGTLETVATGVRWAVDNGAHIISMSLGLEAHRAGGAAAASLAGELERAYRRGVLVIAAAGNGWSTAPFFPACDPHVLAVGALRPGGAGPERAEYSSYGAGVGLFAPGGDGQWPVWSTNRTRGPEQYAGAFGTSMAAPHVAGAAALLRGAGVTDPERMKAALCLGAARPAHYDPAVHGPCGFLDVHGALAVADPPGLEDVRVLIGRQEGGVFRVQGETRAQRQGGFTLRGVPKGSWDVLAWVPRSGADAVRPGDLLGRARIHVGGSAVGGVRVALAAVPAGQEPLRIQR